MKTKSGGQQRQARKKTKFHFYLNIIFLTFLLFLVTELPISGSYSSTDLKNKLPLVKDALALGVPAPYPTKVTGLPDPNLTAQGAIVIDTASAKVLYEKDSQRRLYPASTTKLLTALVAVNYYNPNTILTSYRENVPGSGLELKIGEQMRMSDVLKAVLIPSANDAALMLADNYPGGEATFVIQMNKLAKDLHLDESGFKNPTGLHDSQHFTSARDLGRLAAVAIKNPTIKQIVGMKEATIFDITKNQPLVIENVNQLLGTLGIDGVKTGFTKEAGGCLIAASVKNGHRVISVVLDSNDRFLDTQNLLTFIWSSYRW